MEQKTLQPQLDTPAWPNRLKRILVNKSISYLWDGQVISQAGDSIFEIGRMKRF